MTVSALLDSIFESIRDSATERMTFNSFKSYCDDSDLVSNPVSEFGEHEFRGYLAYLRKHFATKSVYRQATFIRQALKKAVNEGFEFYSSPRLFPVPKKPVPDHFEPLDTAHYERLSDFIREEVDLMYERETLVEDALAHGAAITKNGKDFKKKGKPDTGVSFYSWQESLRDVLYTLKNSYGDYPLNVAVEEMAPGARYGRMQNVNYAQMDTPFKAIYKRMGLQNLSCSKPFLECERNLSFNDVVSHLYPSRKEALIVQWLISLETGWSPDVVKRINPHDYIMQFSFASEGYVCIKSQKFKGQQSSSNISEAKLMIYPSSKDDRYSAYNVVKLWLKRSSRARESAAYSELVKVIGEDPLLFGLSDLANLFNKSENALLAHHPEFKFAKSYGISSRIKKMEIGFDFDDRALRPTSLYWKEKTSNLPLLLQVVLFGHSDSAITDEFYKDGAVFQQDRKDKLAVELIAIEDSIKDGSFKGSLVPLKVNKGFKDRVVTIFTDHAGESPVAVCKDPYSPDWLGSENMAKGPRCGHFSKCLECSQSLVGADNIPFVVDRYIFLKKNKKELRPDQFDSLYSNEFDAVKEVLDTWPYRDEIQEAKDRLFIEGPILPPVLFEEPA